MPLRKGTSQTVVSRNIRTLVNDWKKDGLIGNSHPPSRKRAVRQAVAIALATADKSLKLNRRVSAKENGND